MNIHQSYFMLMSAARFMVMPYGFNATFVIVPLTSPVIENNISGEYNHSLHQHNYMLHTIHKIRHVYIHEFQSFCQTASLYIYIYILVVYAFFIDLKDST